VKMRKASIKTLFISGVLFSFYCNNNVTIDSIFPPSVQQYSVGGTVKGLALSETVVVNNNGTDPVTVTGSGSSADQFTFPVKLDDRSFYSVTSDAKSSGGKNCKAGASVGTITGADVNNVVITCSNAMQYTIGGGVTNLVGTGLVLQNNLADSLPVNPPGGVFTFATALDTGVNYSVTVSSQPTNPVQTCTVSLGTGVTATANVNNISVNCVTSQFAVSGSISGLLLGETVTLLNNGGDPQTVSGGGSGTDNFAFNLQNDATGYNVSVLTPPAGKSCIVTGGAGTLAGTGVNTVAVVCTGGATPSWSIGGNVTGLAQGATLVLQNTNNGESVTVTNPTGAGTVPFTFVNLVAEGTGYTVISSQNPLSPVQTCIVTGGAGTMPVPGANITTIAVACTTSTFAVSVNVTGLTAAGGTLSVWNNGANLQTLTADGAYPFPAQSDKTIYNITASTTTGTTCAVTAGMGILSGAGVTVNVTCAAASTYTVGGTISNYTGTGLVLQNNGGDNLTVTSGATGFTMPSGLLAGSSYAITVLQQPTNPNQNCSVAMATGSINLVVPANITNVTIVCSTVQYTAGGTITGLGIGTIVLQNNGSSIVSITGGGTNSDSFTFPAQNDQTGYNIQVIGQPTGLTCVLGANVTGTLAGVSVTNAGISCSATPTFTLSGNVTGSYTAATGKLVLKNTINNELVTVNPGGVPVPFAFTPIASGASYDIVVATQPTGPNQNCTVTTGGGPLVIGANVTNLAVNCTMNQYQVSGVITGLPNGESVTILNNGVALPAFTSTGVDINFTFPLQNDGSAFSVTVGTPAPATATCAVGGGAGSISGANVTGVTILCTTGGGGTATYTLGGSVIGIQGTGLQLTNSTNADVTAAINAQGSFTFPTTLNNSANYSVSVTTQPVNPSQTCATTPNPKTGTIAGADDLSVLVTCTTDTFTVGGVGGTTGIVAGDFFELTNTVNGDLFSMTAVAANPDFTMPISVPSGGSYDIRVKTHPLGKSCTVGSGVGTVGTANVTTLTLTCGTAGTATIGGTVSGLLAGNTLVLKNTSNGNTATVNGTGGNIGYSFSVPLAGGVGYSVIIQTQPAGNAVTSLPSQTCYAVNTTGNMAATPAAINNIDVTCVTDSFSITGTVAGLATGESLPIVLNGVTGVVVPGAGGGSDNFTITPVANYTNYTLTTANAPNGKSCTWDVGVVTTGQISGANLTGMNITCSPVPNVNINVTVNNLTGGGLTVLNNVNNVFGAQTLSQTYTASATKSFSIPEGSTYWVMVAAQPSAEICSFDSASALILNGTAPLAPGSVSLTINCVTSPVSTGVCGNGALETGEQCDDGNPKNFDGCSASCLFETPRILSYTITGLTSGTLNVKNGLDIMPQTVDGTYSFPSSVYDGETYNIVLNGGSPPGLACEVDPATQIGVISGVNITVNIVCNPIITTYTISGIAYGMGTKTITVDLLKNGVLVETSPNLTAASMPFSFATNFSDGDTYALQFTPPGGLTCANTNITGSIYKSNVTDIYIYCGTLTADGFEVDDTQAAVTASPSIPVNGSFQHHNFHAAANPDFIRLAVDNPNALYIIETMGSTETLCGTLDTIIEVFDSLGNPVASDDKSGPGFCSVVKTQFPAAGDYFIKVTEKNSAVIAYAIKVTKYAIIFQEDFTFGLGQLNNEEGPGATSSFASVRKWLQYSNPSNDYYKTWATIWWPDYSDGSYAVIDSNLDQGGTEAWLVTPVLDMSGYTEIYVDFNTIFRALAGDKYLYQYRTTASGGWVNIPSATQPVSSTYFNEHINISAVASGRNDFEIGFYYFDAGLWHYYALLDNLIIYGR